MAFKIDRKIISYKVLNTEEKANAEQAELEEQKLDLESMHENVTRPEILHGTTYKIKTPQSEHALYITINDMILNEDTEYEERRPYEVFINSKNMEHFQWVLALTRVISAVFPIRISLAAFSFRIMSAAFRVRISVPSGNTMRCGLALARAMI